MMSLNARGAVCRVEEGFATSPRLGNACAFRRIVILADDLSDPGGLGKPEAFGVEVNTLIAFEGE